MLQVLSFLLGGEPLCHTGRLGPEGSAGQGEKPEDWELSRV